MRILFWTTVICVDAAHGALVLPVIAGAVVFACADAHAHARRRGRFPNRASQWHQPPDVGAVV
ncbi:MAG TPA: hypothetical protein VNO31_08475 [Umezawaea sp.]|nr:hypothetical protein [Umezawaea sp.]